MHMMGPFDKRLLYYYPTVENTVSMARFIAWRAIGLFIAISLDFIAFCNAHLMTEAISRVIEFTWKDSNPLTP